MFIDFLEKVFKENSSQDAVIWKDKSYSYEWLTEKLNQWNELFKDKKIPKGSVVILEADFSPNAIAVFLALIEHGCVVVPITKTVEEKKEEFISTAQGEWSIHIDDQDNWHISRLGKKAGHPHYVQLRKLSHPGLVLFSSGSTGKSKAAVHDMSCLLEKFKVRKRRMRTIPFLLYDHIGGVNTLFYSLSNAGCIVTVQDRSPGNVLRAVERHGVELLPTSPTFLNLILLSEAYKKHDISSLKTVTYGTEPMPESTLKRFHELFPEIRLQQTYGLSELGILRSKSKQSDSLWVKIGGEGFQTRVVNGILQIKARSAMLGYLNAPSPFSDDGWFDTGDYVEQKGEYFRIFGRKSEMINVGGEKVTPAEVESVIQEMDNVAEVTVFGEKNLITGNIAAARIRLIEEEDHAVFKTRLRQHCLKKLANYKIPRLIKFDRKKQHGERFKKIRNIRPS